MFNAPNETDVFQIGNGADSDHKQNAFAVDAEGNLIYGPDGFTTKAITGEILATENASYVVPIDDAVYIMKVKLGTSINAFMLCDASYNLIAGTANADYTIVHTEANTWTVTNNHATDALTVTIKRFM